MLIFKNKKETERTLNHIDVFNDGIYIGYIIKSDKWYFANTKDNNLYDTSKGYYSSFEAKTKKELISIIIKNL